MNSSGSQRRSVSNLRKEVLSEVNRLALQRQLVCSEIDDAVKRIHVCFLQLETINRKQRKTNTSVGEWDDQYDTLLEAVVHALAYPKTRSSVRSVDISAEIFKYSDDKL
jgi:hypothetical protein